MSSKVRCMIALMILFAVKAHPDDVTSLKGTVYKNVEVTRIEPDGITMKHSAGIEKIFFSELPPEMRAKYGFSPEKQQKYYDAQARANRQATAIAALDASSINVDAKLNQVLTEGSIAYVTIFTTLVYTQRVTTPPPRGTFGTVQSPTTSDVVMPLVSSSKVDEPVFITGLSAGYVDGDDWSGRLYPIGTFSYTTVQGAVKKIRKYTASRAEAVRFYSE